MKIKNPVTAADVDRFRVYIEKWQILLGLQEWRIEVVHKPRSAMMAETEPDLEHFTCVVSIGRDFGSMPVNDENLESTAIHELCHLLLAPLKAALESKTMSDEEKYGIEEAVVNVLEKLIFDKFYGRLLFKEDKA